MFHPKLFDGVYESFLELPALNLATFGLYSYLGEDEGHNEKHNKNATAKPSQNENSKIC